LARQSVGLIEASATCRSVTPYAFRSEFTTSRGSLLAVMRQVPAARLAAYGCAMSVLLRHQHDRRADDVAAALIAECRAAHEYRDAFRLRRAGWQTRAGKDFSAIQRLLQGAAYQHIVEGRLVVVYADAVDHPRLPASTRDHDVPVALKPRQQVDRRVFEVIHFALQKDRHARRGVGQGEHLRTLDAHDLPPASPSAASARGT